MLLGELLSIRGTDFKVVIVCFNRKFNNLDHGCHRFFDKFRNRLIVQDGSREIRVIDRSESKENDITEQLRVISRWISNQRLIARLIN